MGYSRESFYRFKQLYEEGGEQALKDLPKNKRLPKNRVSAAVEKAVTEFAIEQPAYGQQWVSNELKKWGIFVSSGGVRSIWMRHDLETFSKRTESLGSQSGSGRTNFNRGSGGRN